MKKIAILASGSGSNAENIVNYIRSKKIEIEVKGIFTNNPNAGVIKRAESLRVEYHVFNREDFKNGVLLSKLLNLNVDYIICAGFLWLIPLEWIRVFPNRIINIHPSLLPKYGGKGMYGMHVHKAVVEQREKETGISIHYVNEFYDQGSIIFQAKCSVLDTYTPEDVADKIHDLEYLHFPEVVCNVVLGKL
jgi:phosphoribosylglycinamide formyltransferase 1